MRKLWIAFAAFWWLALGLPATATVTSPTVTVTDTATGSSNVFNYGFLIPYSTDGVTPAVTVQTIVGGTVTTLTSSQYSITGVGSNSGGTVTVNGSNLAAGSQVVITRSYPYVQYTAVPNIGFYPHTVEQTADQLEYQIQQLAFGFNSPVTSFNTRTGSIVLSSSDVTGALTYVPPNITQPYTWTGAQVFDGGLDGEVTVGGGNVSNLLSVYLDRVANVTDFGAQCNGTHDDSSAFTAAYAWVSGQGGGTLTLPPSACLVAASANLNLSSYSNVQLVGQATALGLVSNELTAPYTLIHSGSYTIELGSNDAMVGVRIVRQNMTSPSTLRGAITEVGNFVGTGVAVYGTHDVLLQDVQVNGFATGIVAGLVPGCVSSCATPDRFHAFRVAGDDTAFFSVNDCNDNCRFDDMEAWSFAVYNTNIQPQISTISNATSDGGLIEITLSSAPSIALVTGDTPVIYGVGGTTEANGRWTITVIDSTHFTLNGSTFVHSYTTGGDAYLGDSIRTGAAYSFSGSGVGGEMASGLVEYGHDVGIATGSNHGPTTIHGFWLDGDTDNNSFGDQTPVGIDNQGYATFSGGFISSKAVSVLNNNSGATNRPLILSDSLISVTGCAAPSTNGAGSGLTNEYGPTLVSNVQFSGTNVCAGGYAWNYIQDNTTYVNFSNVTADGGTVRGAVKYQTTNTDSPKFVENGSVYGTYTPVLASSGGNSGVGPVYTDQAGSYVQQGNVVTVQFHVLTSAVNLNSGSVTISLPFTASNASAEIAGTCMFSRWGGITMTANYESVEGQVSPGQNTIALNINAGAGSSAGTLGITEAMLTSSVVEFMGTCVYIIQ